MSITRGERTELHDLVRAALGDRLAELLMAGLDTGAVFHDGLEAGLCQGLARARCDRNAALPVHGLARDANGYGHAD